MDPEARGFVCALKRAAVIRATDQRTTSGPSGLYSPQNKAEDMTPPTTSATPKIALDRRASSRHDKATPTSSSPMIRAAASSGLRRFSSPSEPALFSNRIKNRACVDYEALVAREDSLSLGAVVGSILA